MTQGYVGGVKAMLGRKLVSAVAYAALIGGVVYLFGAIPGGFVPEEDKGTVFVAVDLPAGASAERTRAALKKAEAILAQEPTVQDGTAILGYSIFYRYANQAFIFATLKPWAERNTPETHVFGVLKRLNQKFASIGEARVFALNEPPISGMGSVAGFDYRLLSLDGDRDKLAATTLAVAGAAAKNPALVATRSVAAPEVQTLFLDIDRNKAKALGVPLPELYSTVGTLLGSSFVNQFTAFGTNLKVKMQAEQSFRSDPAALQRFQIRNAEGDLVPLAALMPHRVALGADRTDALQRLPGDAVQRRGGARPQFGRSARRDGGDLGRTAARRHLVRVVGPIACRNARRARRRRASSCSR